MSLEPSEIYPKLTKIFRDLFDDDDLVVTPELTAKMVPGWDSLKNIRLMLSVEKSFGVRFSAAEIGKLQNVGDMVSLIRTKK